jgi:HSP20 family protein
MAIVRWRPVGDLVSMQDEMNRVFEDLWRRSPRSGSLGAATAWWPSIDVQETQNEFRIAAELPGLKRDDVKISLTDNVLTLRGEKRSEQGRESEGWHQMERAYGVFERSFQLTCPVDASKVKARFEDGVLTITLPKSEESRPREISIDS